VISSSSKWTFTEFSHGTQNVHHHHHTCHQHDYILHEYSLITRIQGLFSPSKFCESFPNIETWVFWSLRSCVTLCSVEWKLLIDVSRRPGKDAWPLKMGRTGCSEMSLTTNLRCAKYRRAKISIQINHQPDAAIFQFIILTFIYSSTCFGRCPAHHQELNDYSGSLWFYLRIVVTVVMCSWSGRTARNMLSCK